MRVKNNLIYILTILFCTALYLFLCLCIFRKVPIDSDMATLVLKANDIKNGDFFLSDWISSGISFITTDLLFFIFSSFFFSISVNTYHVAITLMFFVFSISSLLLVNWSTTKNNIIYLLIWLSIGALPIGSAPHFLYAHTAVWIYVFIACFFIHKLYNFENLTNKNKYIYLLIIVSCTALGVIGDAIIIIGFILPVIIVFVFLFLKDIKYKNLAIYIILSLLIGFLLGSSLDKLYYLLGNSDKNSYLSGIKFKELQHISNSFILYFNGLLELFDSNLFGRNITNFNHIFYAPRFLIILFVLYIVIYNIISFFFKNKIDIISIILSLGFFILSIVYIFTTLSIDIMTTRYYAYAPILFFILICRFISNNNILLLNITRFKINIKYLVYVLSLFLIIGIIGKNPGNKWNIKPAPNPYIELSSVLIENNLTNGYAGFWESSSATVTSKNQVRIRQILFNGEHFTPFYWLCKNSWYYENTNFIVTRHGFHGVNEENIIKCFGKPYDILYVNDFKIFVYDNDISKQLEGKR